MHEDAQQSDYRKSSEDARVFRSRSRTVRGETIHVMANGQGRK